MHSSEPDPVVKPEVPPRKPKAMGLSNRVKKLIKQKIAAETKPKGPRHTKPKR